MLSNSQAGPGTTVKQEQEEMSHHHVQAYFPGSVHAMQRLLCLQASLSLQTATTRWWFMTLACIYLAL